MKSFNFVAVASLVAVVAATPVEKRALIVHTVVEQVTETVDMTTTVWVKATNGAHANYQLPAAQHHRHHHNPKPKPTTTTTPPYVAPEPVPTTPSATSTPPTITTPSSTQSSTSTSVSIPAYVPPAVDTPPVVVEPTTQAPDPEPTTEAPAPLSSTPTTSPSEGEPSTETTGGACMTIGGKCSGDITFYEAGLGSCEQVNDGNTEDVFALAVGIMGPGAGTNPNCGRMATIKVEGKPAVTAKLVDKCMGCKGEDIDLSVHLFDQLGDQATGRISGVEWHFTT